MPLNWHAIREEWREYWWEVLLWLGLASYLVRSGLDNPSYVALAVAAVAFVGWILTYIPALRWLVWAMLVVPVVGAIAPAIVSGDTREAIRMTVVVGFMLWATHRHRDPRECEPFQINLLLREPLELTVPQIVAAVERVWGERLRVGDALWANHYAEEVEPGVFGLCSRQGKFVLSISGEPNTGMRDIGHALFMPAIAQVMAEHRDVLTLGLFHAVPGQEEICQRRALQLAGDLTGEGALTISTGEGLIKLLDDDGRQQLRTGDLQVLLREPPDQDESEHHEVGSRRKGSRRKGGRRKDNGDDDRDGSSDDKSGDDAPPETEDFQVCVLLSSEAMLTATEVAKVASRAWGFEVSDEVSPQAQGFMHAAEEGCALYFRGATIYWIPKAEHADLSPDLDDDDLNSALESHQAHWTLVLAVHQPAQRQPALQRFGKLLAALVADDRALAMLAFHVPGAALVDDELRTQLASEDPFGDFPQNLPDLDDDEDSDDEDRKPLVSLVLLLRESRYMDAGILTAAARRAWDLPADQDEDDKDYAYVSGDSPVFMAHLGELLFVIHAREMPYFDDPDEVAEDIDELRRRKAVSEHKAWLSVDLIDAGELAEREEAYRYIGRLAAQLATDDTLAIVCPGTGQIVPYDAELDRFLRSGDPLGVFQQATEPAVLVVDSDDPRMKAAVEEARRRFGEFVASFEKRGREDTHSVKAPISDGEHTEFMWVNVTAVENDIVFGELGNAPVNVTGVASGDRVRVKVGDVADWIAVRQGQLTGGFSIKVIEEIHAQRRAERENDE